MSCDVLKLHPCFQRVLSAAALAVTLIGASSVAHAQTLPASENGRYTSIQVGNDIVRTDTRTGGVSTCTNNGGWTCRIVPDERTALDAEIGKLQSENKALKEQLAQRGDSGKSAQAAPDAKSPGKIELQLPADHEKLMALLDKVWDRLIDMAARLQKKLSDKT